MTPYVNIFSIASFISFVVFSFFLFRFNVERINVQQTLGLVKKGKEKNKLDKNYLAILFKLGDKFSGIGSSFKVFVNEKQLERNIALAGLRDELTVQKVLGLRFVTLTAGLLIALILSALGIGLLIQILAIIAGLLAPMIMIHLVAKRRQEQIGLELPDFLDAMSVSLQAGSPMDPAMRQIISSLDGPLAAELETFQQEVELGVPRETAYKRLEERNDSSDIEMLVRALLQGSKLGVPLANTFSVLAEDLRKKRINNVKEQAAKIGPKVTLIMVVTILPAVLLLIVGLLVLNIIYNPEGLGMEWNLF